MLIITGTGVRPSFMRRLEFVLPHRLERFFVQTHSQGPNNAAGSADCPVHQRSVMIEATSPWYLARRASSQNSASGVLMAIGAEMPPPTR